MNHRMDRKKLNIGTYILQPYARSAAHIRDLRDCGIDFVTAVDYDKSMLDLFQKYNVGAVVKGVVPGWWGGDGTNAGTMAAACPLEKYAEAAGRFADHPAVWGIDCGDEPSASDFPHYGKVVDFVENAFPHQFAYLNLYPLYAAVATNDEKETAHQLGAATYEAYIEAYCKAVQLDYICYDFYLYSASPALAFENLRTVADYARRTDRSVWIVLQVNSHRAEEWISTNKLRYQVFSAMAFGVESIIWACYSAGWWHNHVVDEAGAKTQQYEKLKQVNGEIRRIAEAYMQYRRIATHFVGFCEDDFDVSAVRQKPVSTLNTGIFFDVHTEDGGKFVIGEMARREGSGSALMICAADDSHDEHNRQTTLRFRCDAGRVQAHGGQGELILKKCEDGYFELQLLSNQGALLTVGGF